MEPKYRRETCSCCGGNGDELCSHCGGSGKTNDDTDNIHEHNYVEIKVICSFCGGTGWVRCSHCGGNGYVLVCND